jgi:uncharacterized protein
LLHFVAGLTKSFRDPMTGADALAPLNPPEHWVINMTAPIVFFDIAGPDLEQLRKFYSTVFKWDVGADGRFSTRVVSPSGGVLPASLRQDPAGTMFYIGVDDVTAKLNELQAAGGSIEVPRFEVPGVVVLGLFKDPAGNRLGLVELADGKPKVP